MSVQAAPQSLATDPSPERQALCDLRHEENQAVLGELAEIALDMARTLRAQVSDEDAPQVAADPALAFSRISRAVRLTVGLRAKLDRDALAGTPAPDAAQSAEAEGVKRRRCAIAHIHKDAAFDLIAEVIEDNVRERGEAFDREWAVREASDLYEDDDNLEAWLGDRQREMITALCQHLDLVFDPIRWLDEDGDPLPEEDRPRDIDPDPPDP